ncbi:MAG: right-handed parallel beta-helix repeat-containing protein, partial [Phycisphaerae bacterium]|nr:right-handed parallel beta-helix repeat-containing protein [Phycisphaerae bacterium]
DVIELQPGTYYQDTRITSDGQADAYITIRGSGANPSQCTITGAEAIDGPWTRLGANVFFAHETRPVNTVRQVGGAGRLYHHETLDDLLTAEAPLDLGWYHDTAAGRLYVRLAEDVAPDTGEITAGVLWAGLMFDNAAYWIIENLSFFQFGQATSPRGIDVLNSHDIIIRNCRFAHARFGVILRRGATSRCLVERCDFMEENIWTWPWEASKAHDVEGGAITATAAGGGNVFRFNTIRGPFNGIMPATWSDLYNEAINCDMDVHNNVFTEIADDPIEPEGACMNVRFWSNRTTKTWTGISLAPVTVGPVFVIRDQYYDFRNHAVKVGVNGDGICFVYHILGWSNYPGSDGIKGTQWGNIHFRNSILRSPDYIIQEWGYPHVPPYPTFDYCALYTTSTENLVRWVNEELNTWEELPPDVFLSNLFPLEPYLPQGAWPPSQLRSELIDTGVVLPGINDDYLGAGPDIGPFETVAPKAVVGKYFLYNNSAFDGFDPAAGTSDDSAIAPDKILLPPGEQATFANYTSYSRGINGIVMDFTSAGWALSEDDFRFALGNSSDPADWIPAPAPESITVRLGKGVGGSDRVTILWPDNAIQNQWLLVAVEPTLNTGLAEPDVSYFGNAIGETGNSPADAEVTPTDQITVRNNPHTLGVNPAGITDTCDFNRDRKVTP